MSAFSRRILSASWRLALPVALVLALTGCGFHLRRSVALPPTMQHVYIAGNGELQRGLERALAASGVDVADGPGPGIAEMDIPVSQFGTDSLSFSGAARVTEYAVHYHVEFLVKNGAGDVLLPQQSIQMSREFSYDAYNTVGNAAEVQEIQRSLTDDMVQAILFRLRAAGHRAVAVPAPAGH